MTTPRRRRARAPLAEDAPFEEVVDRLEVLVTTLEAGELPLEASLQAFEEGVSLARRASRSLDEMEHRIEVLTQEGTLEPLGEESDAADDGEA